jgi:hypothetical protein
MIEDEEDVYYISWLMDGVGRQICGLIDECLQIVML